MDTPAEIEAKFWKALADDRTTMLSLTGVEQGHSQPMTAQILHDPSERGPIWFFTSSDTDLFREIASSHRAALHFSSKDHDVFAAVEGELTVDDNRSTIDRLWSPFVAAWFEGGKEDPKLRLMRFDADRAQVWLNENSTWAGIKILLGRDPKKDYQGKMADVRMNS